MAKSKEKAPEASYPPPETADGVPVEFGKAYKDKLHGVGGIATSYHVYRTGCNRVGLEYVRDGEIKAVIIDSTDLVRADDEAPVKDEVKAGGPAEYVERGAAPAWPL